MQHVLTMKTNTCTQACTTQATQKTKVVPVIVGLGINYSQKKLQYSTVTSVNIFDGKGTLSVRHRLHSLGKKHYDACHIQEKHTIPGSRPQKQQTITQYPVHHASTFFLSICPFNWRGDKSYISRKKIFAI